MTSPAPRDSWEKVLGDDPHANVLQTPAWVDLIGDVTGGSDASRLYELPGGRRLVLPLVRRRWLPGVTTQSSYPAGYGLGGVIASGGVRSSDIGLVLDDARLKNALSTRISVNHDVAGTWGAGMVPGWTPVRRPVEVLDLSGGIDVVWLRRYRSSTRRAVRKAQNAEVVVERDTSGALIDAVYDLYLLWTARRAAQHGIPRSVADYLARRREPVTKFRAAAALPGDVCRTWMAVVNGRPAAAIITLVYGTTAFYWRGYSDKELAGPTRANNLLQHLAIGDACAAGCSRYNMGESGGVPELERFKQSFGTSTETSLELRHERLPLSRSGEVLNHAQGQLLGFMGRLRARRTLPE